MILDKEIPSLCQALETWWSPTVSPSCAKRDQKSSAEIWPCSLSSVKGGSGETGKEMEENALDYTAT